MILAHLQKQELRFHINLNFNNTGKRPMIHEIKTNQTIFNIILLPINYLQIISVDLNNRQLFYTILKYEEFDALIKSKFQNSKKLFEAISQSQSTCVQFLSEKNTNAKIMFQFQKNLYSLCCQLTEKDKDKKLCKKDEVQIELYQKQMIHVCDQNKILYAELQMKEKKITELQIEVRLKAGKIDNLTKQLEQLYEQFKQKSFHQRAKQAYLTDIPPRTTYKIPLGSIDYNKTMDFKSNSPIFNFVPYQTQALKNFKITDSTIKLQKQYKKFYQVVSESFIPLTGKTIFGITVIHTRDSDMYFGVMKEGRRKQKFTCQHKEALSYKLRGGKFLYEDGHQTGEQIPWIREGQTLNVILDRQNTEITWFVDKKYMIKRKIPSNMEKEPLYIFVSMHDEGDEVKII